VDFEEAPGDELLENAGVRDQTRVLGKGRVANGSFLHVPGLEQYGVCVGGEIFGETDRRPAAEEEFAPGEVDDLCLRKFRQGALGGRVEAAYRVNPVAEEFNAERQFVPVGE